MTIPTSAIRLSYLWPCNAAHAAFTLSETHKEKISALVLKHRWELEAETFEPIRLLIDEIGERPEYGYPARNARVKVVAALVAAHGDEVAA